MNGSEAEKIINAFGEALAAKQYGNIAGKKSTLPCCKGKIKFAFYVYIKFIFDSFGVIDEKLKNILIINYTGIDAFIDDKEADKINELGERIRNKQLDPIIPAERKLIDEYFAFADPAVLGTNLKSEIEEYINECMKK